MDTGWDWINLIGLALGLAVAWVVRGRRDRWLVENAERERAYWMAQYEASMRAQQTRWRRGRAA